MFYAVDADLRPVNLNKLEQVEGEALIASGEAHSLMSADAYDLVWAKRHGTPARWYLFPHEDERPGLVIYLNEDAA